MTVAAIEKRECRESVLMFSETLNSEGFSPLFNKGLLLRIHSTHLRSGPRYLGFLRSLLTNTMVFLCGL